MATFIIIILYIVFFKAPKSLRFFEKNQDFFRIFVQEENRWLVRSRLAKSAIAQRQKDFSIELIREAQAEGLLRKDVEARQVCEMLESIIVSFIFNRWQDKPQQERDLKAITAIIVDLFINGTKKR